MPRLISKFSSCDRIAHTIVLPDKQLKECHLELENQTIMLDYT